MSFKKGFGVGNGQKMICLVRSLLAVHLSQDACMMLLVGPVMDWADVLQSDMEVDKIELHQQQ